MAGEDRHPADEELRGDVMRCGNCEHEMVIGDWPFCPHGQAFTHDAQISDREAIVLYEHPTKGVRWPGRNDAPIPAHFACEGFVRKEYKGGIADVRRIEKQHGVTSEIGNYDRSGHADRE